MRREPEQIRSERRGSARHGTRVGGRNAQLRRAGTAQDVTGRGQESAFTPKRSPRRDAGLGCAGGPCGGPFSRLLPIVMVVTLLR